MYIVTCTDFGAYNFICTDFGAYKSICTDFGAYSHVINHVISHVINHVNLLMRMRDPAHLRHSLLKILEKILKHYAVFIGQYFHSVFV